MTCKEFFQNKETVILSCAEINCLLHSISKDGIVQTLLLLDPLPSPSPFGLSFLLFESAILWCFVNKKVDKAEKFNERFNINLCKRGQRAKTRLRTPRFPLAYLQRLSENWSLLSGKRNFLWYNLFILGACRLPLFSNCHDSMQSVIPLKFEFSQPPFYQIGNDAQLHSASVTSWSRSRILELWIRYTCSSWSLYARILRSCQSR